MTAGLMETFVYCRHGGVAILIAVTLPLLIGATALGTEVVLLIYKHRQMQLAADSAAFGAATALARGYPSATVEADAIAGSLGFVNGTASATVTVNHPPLSGTHAGNTSAVEVIVGQPQALTMVSFFTATAFNVSARAVALRGTSGGSCVLQTDSSATTGVQVSNGATVSLNQCGLAVNATGSSALSVTGAATLSAQLVSVNGLANITTGGSVNPISGLKVNNGPTADPYANVTMPSQSGCAYTSKTVKYSSSVQQLSPGTYCSGLSIGNGATVLMLPGTYYIKSGSLDIGGGTTVTGTGVTIVLTQNTAGSGYATVTIGNGANVTLTAPTSGATSGILFFTDRNAPNTNVNNFIGGTTETFTGAVYMPTQQINYSNGSSTVSPCTQVIAWHITFAGGTQFNSVCAGTGISAIGGNTMSQLVE